jgi:hypothetical protein
MRNIISACFIITGLLLVLSQERWVRQVFADNCNYAIQAANPNPCAFDANYVLAHRCSANASTSCKDGFPARPPMNTYCGSYSVVGTSNVLQQPNPAGGNNVSKQVADMLCANKMPCVVGNVVYKGYCNNGSPMPNSTATTYAAECCDGSFSMYPGNGQMFVPQAGEESCPQ